MLLERHNGNVVNVKQYCVTVWEEMASVIRTEGLLLPPRNVMPLYLQMLNQGCNILLCQVHASAVFSFSVLLPSSAYLQEI